MNGFKQASVARQGGMTLIELAVVLLVLIGLAGLTLPYVGGFIERTSTSTGAASNVGLYNALAMYQAQKGGYPNNLDLLAKGTTIDQALDDQAVTASDPQDGSSGGNMNWGIVNAAAPGGKALGNGGSITTNIGASLMAAGILTVVPSPHTVNTLKYTTNNGQYALMNGTDVISATFDPAFGGQTPINVTAAGAYVTTVDGMFTSICTGASPYNTPNSCTTGKNYGATIGNLLGYTIPPGHAIIVLGVGSRNSAIGVSMASPPVVFAATPTAQPHLVYARYMAAFDVDTQYAGSAISGNLATPAKLVGVIYGPSSMMLESAGSSIQNFYQGLKQQPM
jgi:type II secretory pathway pseudopilin PulG